MWSYSCRLFHGIAQGFVFWIAMGLIAGRMIVHVLKVLRLGCAAQHFQPSEIHQIYLIQFINCFYVCELTCCRYVHSLL